MRFERHKEDGFAELTTRHGGITACDLIHPAVEQGAHMLEIETALHGCFVVDERLMNSVVVANEDSGCALEMDEDVSRNARGWRVRDGLAAERVEHWSGIGSCRTKTDFILRFCFSRPDRQA